jgi:Domain of unknown function (DUF397)
VTETNWRKSTYSGGQGGECIEVASAPGRVAVRDTTHRTGATLTFTPNAWGAFLIGLKQP